MTSVMERVYAHYDKAFERRGRFVNAHRPTAPLRKPWLPADKNAAILDFGCGIGETLDGLWQAGYRNLEGVDAADVQYQRARARLGQRARLHCADGRRFIERQRAAYDVIVAYDVVEHFTKEEAFALCEDFWRALRPGGVLVIKVQNSSSLLGFFGRDIDFTHRAGYTEFSLFQLFDATGFTDHRVVTPCRQGTWRSWRPWRPLTGLGLRRRLNIALHRLVYWLGGTRPPQCFDFLLEAWSHKPSALAAPNDTETRTGEHVSVGTSTVC